MDDDIFHLGVVDGSLGVAAPGVEGARIIWEEADDLDRFEVEVEALRVLDPASEDEVELAHGSERGRAPESSRFPERRASGLVRAPGRVGGRTGGGLDRSDRLAGEVV